MPPEARQVAQRPSDPPAPVHRDDDNRDPLFDRVLWLGHPECLPGDGVAADEVQMPVLQKVDVAGVLHGDMAAARPVLMIVLC